LLPIEALTRVIRVSRGHGTMMLAISGGFAVLAALSGDTVGAAAGLLVAGAGAMERHGSMLLEAEDIRGIRWAAMAELFAMFAILAYCQVRMITVDVTMLRAAVTDELKAQLALNGIGVDEFLHYLNRIVFFAVAATTVIYQGGMALYYLRRRRAVEVALAQQEAEPA
jgi:hypothetical protein